MRAAVPSPLRRRGVVGFVFAALAIGAVVASLAIIWLLRFSTLPRAMYVSEFGAEGEPTARWFEVALLLLVAGAAVIAWLGRSIRPQIPVLRAWTPTVSLLVACGFFLVASQVTCTAGCPLPVGSTFTWQDFIHTLCAVLAFAAACWGMLQLSFVREHRVIARLSLLSAVSVAVVAGVGGLLSLARFGTDVGSWLELIATTAAIAWLAALGGVFAARAVTSRDSLAVDARQRLTDTVPRGALAAQELEELVG
ncbi:MAG TPA: DUF998 domain-containing protein [Terrimesophilobacter sp.]|nr:DUF998 domain-containing protein [Terrimesophilobacter sp.]HRP99018.1 DUF998 domain-containing protein [Terrimesophilobacter sp.]